MHRMLFLAALLSIATSAHASEGESDTSRGFQLARRVAQLENQKDLPSRAVWLGNRVVKNSRSLAALQDVEKPKAHAKKRVNTVKY